MPTGRRLMQTGARRMRANAEDMRRRDAEAKRAGGPERTARARFSAAAYSFALIVFVLFGALFMVSVTTWYVHEYRGERFFATGRLESVAFDIAGTGNYVLELGVNGERYEIMRPRNEFQVLPYDFGVEGDKALDAIHALETRLRGDIGRTANIEYIQFEDRVLGLTIDGVEYLNADEVVRDHIAYQSLGRNIFAAVFAALLIPFVLLQRRLSRARRPFPGRR